MHAVPKVDLHQLIAEAKQRHAPRSEVQHQLDQIAHIAGSFDRPRREYYEESMRGVEQRLQAGRIAEDEAVRLLQRLGEQAHQEGR